MSDRPATLAVARDQMRAIGIIDQFCSENGYAVIRKSICPLGIRKGLRIAATVSDPAERAQAIQVVIESTDSLLRGEWTFEEIIGIERRELADMDPLALTPARVRFWQVKANLTAVLQNANPPGQTD